MNMFDIRNVLLKGILLILIVSCEKTDNQNITIPTTIPLAPTDLKITGYSAVQVDLEWIDKSTNESGYKIQRKQGNSTYTDIATVGQDVTTYIDKTVVRRRSTCMLL